MDSEGVKQPHATNATECLIPPPIELFTYADLLALFGDVRVLKRGAVDSSGQATKMNGLRSELDDMKFQVNQLATCCSGLIQTVNAHCASTSIHQVGQLADQWGEPEHPAALFSSSDVGSQVKDNGPSQDDDEMAVRTANKGPSFGPNLQPSDEVLHDEENEEDPSRSSAVPHRLSALSALDWRKAQARMESLRYALKETLWDVLVFVRLDMMHWSDELLLVLVGLLNMTIQMLFVLIVSKTMIGGGVDWAKGRIVGDMLDWRVKFAHDPQYADAFTDVSLASAVCEKKTVNMQGIQQANIYIEVDEYLEPLYGVASGDLLCMLCVLLWLFTCLLEFMTCTTFLQGIWLNCFDSGSAAFSGFRKLRSARSSIVIRTPNCVVVEDGVPQKSVVLSISFLRASLITLFAIIPRWLVVASLGYVGITFLTQTIRLEDLILNAVALEIVLHVDEMMYDLFAPPLCKRVVAKTHPLRLAKSSITVGVAMPYVNIISAGSLLALIRTYLLQPILQNLEDTQEVMCAGNKDFLFVELAKGPVLAGVPAEKKEVNRADYNYLAVLQRTGLNVKEANEVRGARNLYLDSDGFNPLFPVPNVLKAQEYTSLQIRDFTSAGFQTPFGVDCYDMTWNAMSPSDGYALGKALAAITGVPSHFLLPPVSSIAACSYLFNQSLCYSNETEGKWVRFYCPATCGCGDPLSGLAYNSQEEGNPIYCSTSLMGNALYNLSFPCVDLPLGSLAFETYAVTLEKVWYSSAVKLVGGNVTRAEKFFREFTRPIASLGCAYAGIHQVYVHVDGYPYSMNRMMCSPEHMALLMQDRLRVGRSLRYLCPVSCGCHSTVKTKIATDGTEITGEVLLHEHCMRSCLV